MSKNKIINADNLVRVVIIVCIISTIILAYTFINTIYGQDLNKLDFCVQSKCIDFLANKITGVVQLAQFFGWLITLIAALGGAIIALRTYVSGIDNSNITNHIAHFSMFRDFVNTEVIKRKKISPDSIDVHLWYSTIFPKSKDGDLNCSEQYKSLLADLIKVINDANFHISDLTGKYKYQTHQRRMKDSLKEIGIIINSGPKNIFIDIELEILGLIDSVNSTFIDNPSLFCKLERKYS